VSKKSPTGALCALLTGFSYIAMGITYGNLHMNFFNGWTPESMLLVLGIEIAGGAMFALGAIRPITSQLGNTYPYLITWAYNIAFAGYMISAMDSLTPLKPGATRLFDLDPYNVLTHGGVGFWVLVVSMVSWRTGAWPRYVSVVGFAASMLLVVFVISVVIPIQLLGPITGMVGGCVVLPLWFMLVAWQLLHDDPPVVSDNSSIQSTM